MAIKGLARHARAGDGEDSHSRFHLISSGGLKTEDRTLSRYYLRIIEEYRVRMTQGTESVSRDHEPAAMEFEIQRFQGNLGHRLLVDKKLRDPWVCLLVRGLKWSVPKVAKMLI